MIRLGVEERRRKSWYNIIQNHIETVESRQNTATKVIRYSRTLSLKAN
jgi:hypothetical protein